MEKQLSRQSGVACREITIMHPELFPSVESQLVNGDRDPEITMLRSRTSWTCSVDVREVCTPVKTQSHLYHMATLLSFVEFYKMFR